MSRKKILIVGGSVTVVSFVIVCVALYFLLSVAKASYASGSALTSSGEWQAFFAFLSACGFSLTSIAGAVLTPIAAYFGVGADTTKRLIVSAEDAAQITSYMQLYSAATDPETRLKIREAARSETDSLFNTWFPMDTPTQ